MKSRYSVIAKFTEVFDYKYKKRDVHSAHLFNLFSQKVFSVSYPNIFKKSTSFSVKKRNLARGKSFLVKPANATLSNFMTS